MSIIGLKDADSLDIEELKMKYPDGEHITHLPQDGSLLPYNGVFYTNGMYIHAQVATGMSYCNSRVGGYYQ